MHWCKGWKLWVPDPPITPPPPIPPHSVSSSQCAWPLMAGDHFPRRPLPSLHCSHRVSGWSLQEAGRSGSTLKWNREGFGHVTDARQAMILLCAWWVFPKGCDAVQQMVFFFFILAVKTNQTGGMECTCNAYNTLKKNSLKCWITSSFSSNHEMQYPVKINNVCLPAWLSQNYTPPTS